MWISAQTARFPFEFPGGADWRRSGSLVGDSVSALVRAGTLTVGELCEVLGNIPSPELDNVASGIRDISSAATAVTVARMVVVQDL